MIRREWDFQFCGQSWPLQFGFHVDHTDPSITVHLPFIILAAGRLKQPGFRKKPKPDVATDAEPRTY